jgi:hypothetical protein
LFWVLGASGESRDLPPRAQPPTEIPEEPSFVGVPLSPAAAEGTIGSVHPLGRQADD